MATEALQKSRRREIRQLARAIGVAQSQEIKQMQDWRLSWYPLAPQEPVMWHEEMGHQMAMTPEMISAMRMDTDLGAADPEFDLRFLQAMIQHHEGGSSHPETAVRRIRRQGLGLADELSGLRAPPCSHEQLPLAPAPWQARDCPGQTHQPG
ncbi:hypothetical protein ACVWW8_000255 [Thermostichus sp. MS-CIW-22]